VPTIAEAGLPGYDVTTWFGLVAPVRVPQERVLLLNRAIVAALATAGSRERLQGQGIEPIANSPAQFAALLRAELPKWARVVKMSGAKVD
jgi:tripartite-type tricarboxylate transporter receptor subunit TctC